jgi:hypothetical protein
MLIHHIFIKVSVDNQTTTMGKRNLYSWRVFITHVRTASLQFKILIFSKLALITFQLTIGPISESNRTNSDGHLRLAVTSLQCNTARDFTLWVVCKQTVILSNPTRITSFVFADCVIKCYYYLNKYYSYPL